MDPAAQLTAIAERLDAADGRLTDVQAVATVDAIAELAHQAGSPTDGAHLLPPEALPAVDRLLDALEDWWVARTVDTIAAGVLDVADDDPDGARRLVRRLTDVG